MKVKLLSRITIHFLGSALFASSDVTKLIKEINLMVTFSHPNVMTLKGVCLDQENPLLIMPFMSNGTILEYVRHNKEDLMLTDEADTLKVYTTNYITVVIE